jgi:hypothetical protein
MPKKRVVPENACQTRVFEKLVFFPVFVPFFFYFGGVVFSGKFHD